MCGKDADYPEVPPLKSRSTNLEPIEIKPSTNGNGLTAYKSYPKKLSKAERIAMAAQLKADADVLILQGNCKAAQTLLFRASEIALGVGYGPFKQSTQ